MNQKLKKILLGLSILLISLILLFFVLGIFISFPMTKAGSLFSLSMSVLFGILLFKCIKTLKGNSFKNKIVFRSISISCIVIAFVSIFFLPESKTSNNTKLANEASLENKTGIGFVQNDTFELENQFPQLNESIENDINSNISPIDTTVETDSKVSEIISNYDEKTENSKITESANIEKELITASATDMDTNSADNTKTLENKESISNTRTVVENPEIIDKSRSTQKAKIKVYVGSKGKKYHYKHCRTLRTSKTLTSYTIDEAKAKGYTSCGVCNPPIKD